MLSNAKTRDELQAMVKAALTPADLAMIDQREAVIRDVVNTFAENRALMLDPRIESRVLFLMRTHGASIDRGVDHVMPPQHLRVEGRSEGSMTETLDTSRPSLTPLVWCDYCNEIEGRGNVLLASVPFGAVAVELAFCSPCAAHLQQCFPRVRWSEWTPEQFKAEVERRRRNAAM